MTTFSKSDFWRAVVAGEVIALLTIPIFRNLKVFELVLVKNSYLIFLGLWLLFLPFAAAFGLYIFFRLSNLGWPAFFQIGKYGIIGLLNTFLAAGIFNFLILITGISRGLLVDIFVIIAFCITITNAFFWNKFWTFNANAKEKIRKEYIAFFTVSSAVALLNVLLLHILINIIGAPRGFDGMIWANIAYFSLIPVSFFGNFFSWKFFVFKA